MWVCPSKSCDIHTYMVYVVDYHYDASVKETFIISDSLHMQTLDEQLYCIWTQWE